MTSVACIGECMVELRHLDDVTLALGFGGDTLNTAVYLARQAGAAGLTVHYVTVLGDDAYSDEMVRWWEAEGIVTDLVARLPGRLPGLYIIRTDADGERSFTYYRSASAARELFHDDVGGGAAGALAHFDWLYLSGITLSILDHISRQRLWGALDEARQRGARVAFDTNYRPASWPDVETARSAVHATLQRVDLALPSLDDHRRLFADADADACARRLHDVGVAEVVVKQGGDGCVVSAGGTRQAVATVPSRAVDTTAAGDAFNAAYLAARSGGATPQIAAERGHRLAGAVVGHPGAIIPREAMPRLDPGGGGAHGDDPRRTGGGSP